MNTIDRNQAIGLVLISGMLIAYFAFFSGSSTKPENIKPITEKTQIDTSKVQASVITDTVALKKQFGDLSSAATGVIADYILENEEIKIIFSNKGGVIKDVLLKKYKTYSKTDLYVLQREFNSFALLAYTQNGKTNLSELFFLPEQKTTEAGKTLQFSLQLGSGKTLIQSYTLPEKGYELKYNIKTSGLNDYIKDKALEINWLEYAQNTEKDLVETRKSANITYRLMNGTYNSLSEGKMEHQEEKLASKVNWIAFKQKFFTAGFISDNGFTNATIASEGNEADSTKVKTFKASLFIPIEDLEKGKGNFKFYFGPNDLSIVNKVAPSFNENVYLGWPVINTINRYTMAPLFNFLERFISNYGLIIICMVLLIKMVLFPLSFQAYKSMAKMKVLKPEIDEIKSRVGDDMSALQQEQMKLYQQVGINPLSGCIPVLLQMPVLLAMFNFFPNAIELRQQPFLWAEDLSTYDSILSLPFKIPFYGDHISLFALLMTASTILYTWYNNQTNVSATGPMIAMSYIMPGVFLFILNSMPAGLSFYYFASNMITIGQQYVIKAFVDEKSIRSKLDENKKNSGTKKPNRFQQRLMDAMEQQKELKKKTLKK